MTTTDQTSATGAGMTPSEIRAAIEAHAAACRVAIAEMRPRPDLPRALTDANLADATIAGFRLRNGKIRQVSGGKYIASSALTESGRILQFGCVTLTLPDWRTQLLDLCEQHEPDCVDRYVAEIGALLDWCETLDRGPA